MSRRSPRARSSSVSLLLLTALTVAGCTASPTAPSAVLGQGSAPAVLAINNPDLKTFVFTAQLRSVDNPEILVGTLVLRLTNAVDNPDILVAAELKNLATPYTGGQILAAGGTPLTMDDPDIKPGATLFSLKTNISASLAALMVDDPDLFVATFFTAAGPAARGTLQLGQPSGR